MHISNLHASFQYHGAKFSYLPRLLPLLKTPHKHFIDVFGGSASVILNMPPASIETYNDLNGRVVNFFKTLRTCPDDLINALQLTPYSKDEYKSAGYCDTDTDVEKARKFFTRTQQSLWAAGGQTEFKGWAASREDSRSQMSEKVKRWLNSINNLQYVADRFKHIQIENSDFRSILKTYDGKNTLFYLDSPYKATFRGSTSYEFEFTNNDFFDLQYWCKKAVGKVAISGYDEPFMNELFKDFNVHKGPVRRSFTTGHAKVPAHECLWTNYEPDQ